MKPTKNQVGAMIRTVMMKRYMFFLVFRAAVFVGFFSFYLWDRHLLQEVMQRPIRMGITPIHILWVVFMVTMLLHLFPTEKITMAARKAKKRQYAGETDYDKLELYEFVQTQNFRAWLVMLCWLFFNGIFGALYLAKVIADVDLFMLSVFYYLSDYICILFYCPFQHLIMKNRCCINCRIFDWGHFMMFTPMLFIRNFFSWSLFFTSCVVLIHWELIYAKHPERFWYGSNQHLQCTNCQDKTCQIKKKIVGDIG